MRKLTIRDLSLKFFFNLFILANIRSDSLTFSESPVKYE